MFERSFDDATGIITVRAVGVWTSQEVSDHFMHLREMISVLRRRDVPIRVMVDIREAQRQSQEIEDQFVAEREATYRPGDRIAILASTPDDKQHLRELLPGDEMWVWTTPLAAEQWLTLDGKRARST